MKQKYLKSPGIKEMGELSKHFIEQFHSLPGVTINEKRRNLFQLFHKNHSLLSGNKEELEFIATNLKPNCYLEKTFRIDFLIHFRRYEELLKDYFNGDEITMRKVKKHDWFFQNILKNVKGEDFVNNIALTMPYVVKLKLLKKLPFEEKQADEIFDALYKRYGIFLATMLLPKCSACKIEETLKSQLVKLTSSQLKLIYNKDPNLIYLYFEERTKYEDNTIFMNNNPVFVDVAQKDPEAFTKLFSRYKFKIKIGYKTTKTFISSQKSAVLNKIENYIDILNKKAVVQMVGSQLKKILFKPIPDSRQLYWNVLLKYYPKSQQYDIFKSYNSNFYHNFETNFDAITENILKIITDPSEKERLAKRKLEKDNNKKYLQYVTPSYCMNEFKKLLNEMTISEKADYVKYLTLCLIANKDVSRLLELCEIIAVRLKNDHRSIRLEFLYSLQENLTLLEMFGENDWKLIFDIFSTAKANEEQITYLEGPIYVKYLEYLIINEKPIRDVMLGCSQWLDWIRYNPILMNVKVCKKILNELLVVGPTEINDEDEVVYYDMQLVYLYSQLNMKNPECTTKVLNYPRILQSFKNLLEKGLFLRDDSALKFMICRKDSLKLLEELKTLYFKNIMIFGQISICIWFLKYEPRTFQKYFHYFLEGALHIQTSPLKRIWYMIRNYTHLGLDKEIVEFLHVKLQEEHTLQEEFVEALTILSPSDSHLEFMKSYVPTCFKIEAENLKNTLQCNLIKFLHLTKSPAAVLPVALQFCKSNFLKFALCPLYSCMCKLPENHVKAVIEKLSQDEETCVKKQAVHLSCAFLDIETAHKYLKDPAIPSLIAASKYFVKNPSDFLWKVLETRLSNVDRRDLYIVKWVMQKSFHLTYKTKYIEKVWAGLNTCQNEDIKKMMVEQIDLNTLKQLPLNFVYKITEDVVFKMEGANTLVANLLMYINDESKYEFVANVLKDFKENAWTCKETQRDARRTLNTFISSITKNYFEADSCLEDFVEKFSLVFKSLFRPPEAFQEFVMISLLTLKGKTVENCATMLVEFSNALKADYGKYIVDFVGNAVKQCISPVLFKTDFDKMELCYFISKSRKSIDDYLLIIQLLPVCEPEDKEHCTMYKEVFTELEQVDDDFVCLQFNLYLRSKNEEVRRRKKKCRVVKVHSEI